MEQVSGQSSAQVETTDFGTIFDYSGGMRRIRIRGLVLALALLPVPAVLQAQTPGRAAVIKPAPAAPSTQGRTPRGRGWGGGGWGWGVWPWGGWTQREEKPLPKPFEPEPPARAWVENKDYSPPRLNPAVTEYLEGVLAAPRPEAGEAAARIAPCRLVLNSGESVEAVWCEWRADTVRYEDDLGRITRLSLDLVNRQASARPDRAPR
jgi:hypothetical protein